MDPRAFQLAGSLLACAVIVVAAMATGVVSRRHSGAAQREATTAALAATLAANASDAITMASESDNPGALRAVALHEVLRKVQGNAGAIEASSDVEQTRGLSDRAAQAIEQFEQWTSTVGASPTSLLDTLVTLRSDATAAAARLSSDASVSAERGEEIVFAGEAGVVLAALMAAGVIAASTLVLGRRLNRALALAEAEKQSVLDASRAMARRNEQFTALYQVISEVTETLNLKYVARTTIHEVRKLIGADVVDLRLLQGDALQLIGSEQDVEADAEGLDAVQLGAGITGRAAKRGRTQRVDEDAEAHMVDGERILGMQSGLVVPLIVGARVVGTLGCWSRRPALFGEDDEQVLEMMASQVATAIASANTHEASERAAHHDALTSLPNRRQLNADLRGPLLASALSGEKMAVAMIDIDHFKRFNDDYGHKVGDVTLQRVSEVLRASIRQEDRVYRFGGEEFLVIFAGADSGLGGDLAERVRASVERTTLTGERMEPVGPVTISIGVAALPEHGRHVEELIDRADRAMYRSKEAGRNRVTVATSDAPQDAAA